MRTFLLWLLYVNVVIGFRFIHLHDFKVKQRRVCGYKSCTQTDPDQLNVHLVPHSHNDVGWVRTVDQYYNGGIFSHLQFGVRGIINSVITALEENPERRYVQAETAFFHKWWQEQNETRRNIFRNLVNSGRLEIVNGAWSMNDEAAAHYQSIIDQFTLGLKTINDTLGECGKPRVGWQLDPFGHSREMASIYSQMGYDGLFFSRLDFRDKQTRLSGKTPEMIWQGDPNLGDNSNLFTSILYNHYSAPSGFCFDMKCSDVVIHDNPRDISYNYRMKISQFAQFVRSQANAYPTNNVLITMGDDFHYESANINYDMMDKLVRGFELFPQYYDEKRINVFYSTPSCYLKAVNDMASLTNLSFPLKTDDFFPYASNSHEYWTGYFTSRPTSKRFERQGNNILQVTKQLSSFHRRRRFDPSEFRSLQEIMGVMQHHDAITGTEQQHVADDYHKMLSKAIEESIAADSLILSDLLLIPHSFKQNLHLESCLLSNVSVCPFSRSFEFITVVYNPLSRPVSPYIRLPIRLPAINIEGPNGQQVTNQILPAIDHFAHLSHLKPSPFEVVFRAENLPPLGAKSFKFRIPHNGAIPEGRKNVFKIGNDMNGVELDPHTRLLKRVTLNGISLDIKQQLMYYHGSMEFYHRPSGAYIFRPNQTARSFIDIVEVTTFNGDLVDEIHQAFSPWAKQIIRLYKNASYVEFDWLVGPIPVEDDAGKEVISRFTTSLDTGDMFYTDANGRQMVPRRRNYRETYPYTNEESISGNYYPITSKILLKDHAQNMEFAVLTDRAQGGSSLVSGEVEIMLHRRLLLDDEFGVEEPLNEFQYEIGLIARGQHYLTFGHSGTFNNEKTSAAIQKDIAQQKLLAPWIFLSPLGNYWSRMKKEFSGLTRALPENVQILTLEPWRTSDRTLLLRLEHVFEKNEDPILSTNVSVDLDGLFSYFTVESVKEMTLAANQPLNKSEKLQWMVGSHLNEFTAGKPGRKYKYVKPLLQKHVVDLSPMQIRTFLLTRKDCTDVIPSNPVGQRC